MSLFLAGAVVGTQLMNKTESHTVGSKGSLPFPFILPIVTVSFDLEGQNTWVLFGIREVQSNYHLVFQ